MRVILILRSFDGTTWIFFRMEDAFAFFSDCKFDDGILLLFVHLNLCIAVSLLDTHGQTWSSLVINYAQGVSKDSAHPLYAFIPR